MTRPLPVRPSFASHFGGKKAGSGGGGYIAKAVHLDGLTNLSKEAVSSPNCTSWSFSTRFKFSGDPAVGVDSFFYVFDPANAFSPAAQIGPAVFGGWNVVEVLMFNSDSTAIQYVETAQTINPTDGSWHHILADLDCTGDVQSGKLYVDDVDCSNLIDWNVTGLGNRGAGPFTALINGLKMVCFDDTFGDGFVGDISDFWVGPGIALRDGTGDIPLATRRLFIDENGKPVNPATAVSALGTPAVLFSGDADTFPVNQGSEGAFTLTGTMTNATTSPSD